MGVGTSGAQSLNLRVAGVRSLNALIREIRLAPADAAALPAWLPGAHIKVQVVHAAASGAPAAMTPEWREYSLINPDGQPDGFAKPASFVIAVRLEAKGRGGSAWMHQLKEGDELVVQEPVNAFPPGEHAGRSVLIAGGIGVTPLLSMAGWRARASAPVEMHYAVQSRAMLAYHDELAKMPGLKLHLHVDEEAGKVLDVQTILAACGPDDHLYVCGPKPLLDAVLSRTQALGWPPERVHFEVFSTPVVSGDPPFEVVLAQSGKTLLVPGDRSLLDVLIDAGCDPMFDCKRGECGVCAVPVLEGDIDHRDYVLSAFEKKGGQVIQSCVSRCKGPRLVLDM